MATSADGTYLYVTGYLFSLPDDNNYGTVAYLARSGGFVGTRLYNGSPDGEDYGLAIAADSTHVIVTDESKGATNMDYATVAYTI